MKPVKLLCENFKGLDFEHELKLVNMFTGPNESGKTARLRAAIVALLGHDPEIGKQPSATIGFASDRRMDMTIHMEFDNDLFITRTFKRKPNGDVSRTNKGEIPEVPAVIFDAEDYLAATAQERIKTVFNRIDVSKIGIKDDDLIEKLSKIEAIPAAESQKAVAELLDLVKKSINRRTQLKSTIQAWLEELVKTLQDAAKGQKSLMDGVSGQLQALRPQGRTPESAEAKIKEVAEKIQKLTQQESEYKAARENFLRTDSRRTSLRELLKKPATDIAALEAKKAAIEKELGQHESTTASLRANVEALSKEWHRLDSGIKKMQADIAAYESKKTDLAEKQKCPYCKSNRQGWKEEYRTELDAKIESTKTQITENTKQRDLVADEGRKVKADLAAAEKADERQTQKQHEIDVLTDQIAKARKEETERAQAEGELKGLDQITAPDEAAVNHLRNELFLAQQELTTHQQAEVAYQQFIRNKDQFDASEKKMIEHQVRVEVYKQAAALVIAEQKAIVAKAFDSILAPARRFTDGIIGGHLDYQNDELGISTDNGWVGHKFMAGRGKDLAYLGLQVALAQQSPIKVIVLDEFGDFDHPTKVQVVDRLLELAKEGFIDAAFCADPDPVPYREIKDENFFLVELAVR
jgi:hypothetical protein